MALHSMTGFARVDGTAAGLTWFWELRSVNGKGLDVRTRLPTGADALEPDIRKAISKKLKRGNCSVSLAVKRDARAASITLNEALFKDLVDIGARASAIAKTPAPSIEALLAIRGVIDFSENDETSGSYDAHRAALMESFDALVAQVVDARSAEGDRLQSALTQQIDAIAALINQLEQAPGRSIERIREKFLARVQRLLAEHDVLDTARIQQEVVLLATKADIEEELARLVSHVAAARKLLDASEPVGRQLDFLSQEFNREANTVCSKSHDEEITQIGLQLKTVIDQFREQVQNIE
ncbi:MAG: YicC/YloC family endoribonuclease [Pseudomonadota bacterium]